MIDGQKLQYCVSGTSNRNNMVHRAIPEDNTYQLARAKSRVVPIQCKTLYI